MTSSARASNEVGIVRPSAFAALRLMTNRKVVACWMGISLTLAPRRTLSTMSEAFQTADRALHLLHEHGVVASLDDENVDTRSEQLGC